LFENDNDFKVFNEVLGDQINNIFNQKLLLADNLGTNMGDGDEEKPCLLLVNSALWKLLMKILKFITYIKREKIIKLN
jgi:hypothetical protein